MSHERVEAREQDEVLADRFTRYTSQLGLSEEHADLLTGARGVGDFFEAAITLAPPQTVASWLVTDVRALLSGRTLTELPFDGVALGRLVGLTAEGSVSRRAAKDVLARMAESGGDPVSLVEEMGLGAVSDEGALGEVVDEVLAAWPAKVEEYRGGRKNLVGLFVGEVMKATRGAADPAVVRSILAQRLDS
jgi:aspartyl-tRNA(Asn)/glutamyl-tRNA(Gln) amidotransferase subunit B